MRSIAKHPVVSWTSLRRTASDLPSLLDLPHRVMTRSGRSAIALALRLAGVGRGDLALVPNYYCPTMVAPVVYVGADPVFYPVDAAGAPDLEVLERWPGPAGGARVALLAVHYFGIPQDFDRLRAYCDGRGIVMIEDCAHACFGYSARGAVGATGDYAIGSLPKFFPTLEGGLLASKRPLDAGALASAGVVHELRGLKHVVEAAAAARRGRVDVPAMLAASRFALPERRPGPEQVRRDALADPLLAPARLRSLERWLVERDHRGRNVERRRANYLRFAAALDGVPGATVPFRELPSGAVPYVFPILVRSPDEVYARLRRARLPAFRWDRYWLGADRDLAEPRHAWGHDLLQLSCHQDLGPDDVDAFAALVRAAVGES